MVLCTCAKIDPSFGTFCYTYRISIMSSDSTEPIGKPDLKRLISLSRLITFRNEPDKELTKMEEGWIQKAKSEMHVVRAEGETDMQYVEREIREEIGMIDADRMCNETDSQYVQREEDRLLCILQESDVMKEHFHNL